MSWKQGEIVRIDKAFLTSSSLDLDGYGNVDVVVVVVVAAAVVSSFHIVKLNAISNMF